MKKLFLLTLLGATALGVQAQTAVKKQLGLITKISATWCNPCGSWGWTLASNAINANAGKAMYIGAFPDNDPSWNDMDFYSNASTSWNNQFGSGGYPSFAINAVDKNDPNTNQQTGGINTTGVLNDLNDGADAFAAAATVASTGYTFSLNQSTKVITVKTKTKFWAAANGDYYVAAYITEDGAMHSQNGQTDQTHKVAHHHVLRGSMSGASASWGVLVASGSIAANAEYTKDFSFTITNSQWDLSKISVVTVIWKKNGTKYDYVNGNDAYEFPSGIGTIENMANFVVYPNPASDKANLTVALKNPASVTINVTDAMGRLVHTSGQMQFQSGSNGYVIPTSNLASGLYNVAIISEGGVMTQRLSVIK